MSDEVQELRKRGPDDTAIRKSDKGTKVNFFDAELWHSQVDSEREKKRHKEND